MTRNELIYRLALNQVSGIGPVRNKRLIAAFGDAESIFKLKLKNLKKTAGLSQANAEAIATFRGFDEIERELSFIEKNNIRVLCFDEETYPSKLKNCVDSPSVLFLKGNVDIQNSRILSVIGTRSYTEYGRKICEELIEGLKPYNVIVVSGLAYGIDIIAHRACLKNEIPTVGVVAHGLNTIYPAAHSSVAREMLEQGGLLSEYCSDSKLEKGNFPSRNRIVAGLSDATIVIETDVRGGSMITADIAFSYNRDVFCFPGRSIDSKSAGCNLLIKNLKAQLVTGADDIAKEMGWKTQAKPKVIQKELFVELSENEQNIVSILRQKTSVHIDELLHLANLSSSQIATSMLNLEMQQIIKVMPGKMVSLS